MQIIKENSYIRDKTKLINKNHLLKELIEDTELIFLNNLYDKRVRLHQINCKKDKNRYSITILNTQYRILATICNDISIFIKLVNHKTYDRINKNC
jgi:mRNA-degrading endonuclease HigB of HigAB toxin-antitoxin module